MSEHARSTRFELQALEWFAIPGRGNAAVIAPRDDLPDPGVLRGQRVLIDGTPHLVTGVETFAVPRSADHPYRHNFSLLVAAGSSSETCFFWDIHARVCRYEMLFLGCEPCAACPGPDEHEPSGPIFIESYPGEPDRCGNCGITVGEHGEKCGEYRGHSDDVGWFPGGDPADDSYIGGYRPGVEGD